MVQSVRGTNNASDWAGRLGEVVLTAADVGAASTQQLATTNANVTTAQAKADLAYTTATAAQTSANGKLSEVATMQTDSITMIQGKGTAGDPLQVLRAYPCGTAVGADLTGSYPASVQIGTNKITYAKMQQVSSAGMLLGGPRLTAGNIVEIGIGTGLAFNTTTSVLECTIASSAALLAAAGTSLGSPQTWGGYNAFTNSTAFGSTISAPSGSITGLGISSTAGITAATTITAGQGLTVTSGGLTVTAGGIGVTANGITVTAGDVTISTATTSTTTGNGALKVAGGVGIGGTANIGGVVKLTDATDSTTSSTGALQVAGGVGIAKNLSINGKILGGNPTTYGSITVTGSTGTYSGIQFSSTTGNRTLMVRNSDGLSGVFDTTNNAWDWYFATGTGTSGAGGALTVGTVPVGRITGVLPVANGGTGSSTGVDIRNAIGSTVCFGYGKSSARSPTPYGWSGTGSTFTAPTGTAWSGFYYYKITNNFDQNFSGGQVNLTSINSVNITGTTGWTDYAYGWVICNLTRVS